MERHSSLAEPESGRARILAPSEYPEPLKRFLSRQRRVLHLELSPSSRKKLEQFSRDTGIPAGKLALRWVEQGIKREASR
jgi:hypothetical protein